MLPAGQLQATSRRATAAQALPGAAWHRVAPAEGLEDKLPLSAAQRTAGRKVGLRGFGLECGLKQASNQVLKGWSHDLSIGAPEVVDTMLDCCLHARVGLKQMLVGRVSGSCV